MRAQRGFSAVETVIIVAVVGLLGFVGWWVYASRSDSKKEESTQNSNQQEEQQQRANTEQDETADWKSYSNTNLGISFKYPESWGEVVTEAGAPSGVLLGFSKNHSIVFGSYGSVEGRSATIYDFSGYTKEGDIYYFNGGGLKDAVTPKTVVKAQNTDVLVVDNEGFATLKDYFEIGILKGQEYSGSDLAGLVNVSTTYKGIVFVDQQKRDSSPFDTTLSTGQVPESEFIKMLSTITIL